MKISFVVPVFNSGAYLDDAVASIRNNACPGCEIEIGLVDDASTDGRTLARVEAIGAQAGVRVERLALNVGIRAAMRDPRLQAFRRQLRWRLGHDLRHNARTYLERGARRRALGCALCAVAWSTNDARAYRAPFAALLTRPARVAPGAGTASGGDAT